MSVDMFMKIKGVKSGDIKGESRDAKGHREEIDVLKWNWGMSAPVDASTAQRSGKTQVHNFTFTKHIDKASAILVNAILTNEELEATLTCRRLGVTGGEPVEFQIIKFEKAMVSKISRSVEHDDERLTEDVTLTFVKFTENYKEITLDGKVGAQPSASYDLRINK